MKNVKKSTLPLVAVSYLQSLANGNPKMVAKASEHFYAIRDEFDAKKITQKQYMNRIVNYIQDQLVSA